MALIFEGRKVGKEKEEIKYVKNITLGSGKSHKVNEAE